MEAQDVKALRRSKGLTQRQLADLCGCKTHHIYMVEASRRLVSPMLAVILGYVESHHKKDR